MAAPERFAERDIYFAHEQLPPGVELPDSDMLKEVHRYAGRFYETLGRDSINSSKAEGAGEEGQGAAGLAYIGDRHVDELSMDETALLAFGILLEEAGREVLGANGDLIFTQAEEDDGMLDDVSRGARGRSVSRGGSGGPEDDGTLRRSDRKRVKLSHPENSDLDS